MARAHTPPRRISSGAVVFGEQTDPPGAYTILSGWVALTDSLPDGRAVILCFALPGDVIPAEYQVEGSSRSAVAVGEVTVCAFTRARHERLRRDDRLYDERYLAAVARQLRQAYDHMAGLALATAAERVTTLLWELAVRSLRRRPLATDRIRAPLTQIQVGLATGLTAVHVSRTLRQLRQDGLIAFHGHTVAILDPARVERLARVSADTLAGWL